MKEILNVLLKPVPIFVYQPFLQKILQLIIKHHPHVFDRIGSGGRKIIAIQPTNLPFALLLRPDPANPSLRAVRNLSNATYDASISGSLLNLIKMVDGQLDGDALFFSRDLEIRGDTEAIVCLRNALDNMDHSLAEELARMFGKTGHIGLSLIRHTPKVRTSIS